MLLCEDQASNCSAVTYSTATERCYLHSCTFENTNNTASLGRLYVRKCPEAGEYDSKPTDNRKNDTFESHQKNNLSNNLTVLQKGWIISR